MNKRIWSIMAAGLAISVLFAIATSIRQPSVSQSQAQSATTEQHTRASFPWRDVLSNTAQFAPKQTEAPKVETVEKPIISLSDGRLVAIVVDNPKSAQLIVPANATQGPISLSVGEGWLDNWRLLAIEKDSVTWQHNETGERHTQYLFGTDTFSDAHPKKS
ncbi:hypothetical protein [Bowmanella pacifica]|nr:hypothetical protein [Bowmanella pacifica]